MAATGRVGGKKSKRKDARPARMRYWMKRTLEKRKAKALMGFRHPNPSKEGETLLLDTLDKAISYWHKVRTSRVPDGYLRRSVV